MMTNRSRVKCGRVGSVKLFYRFFVNFYCRNFVAAVMKSILNYVKVKRMTHCPNVEMFAWMTALTGQPLRCKKRTDSQRHCHH